MALEEDLVVGLGQCIEGHDVQVGAAVLVQQFGDGLYLLGLYGFQERLDLAILRDPVPGEVFCEGAELVERVVVQEGFQDAGAEAERVWV